MVPIKLTGGILTGRAYNDVVRNMADSIDALFCVLSDLGLMRKNTNKHIMMQDLRRCVRRFTDRGQHGNYFL